MKLSLFYSSIHKSTEFKFPNFLNNIDFPSITGLPDIAPKFPNPKTAVPFDITATILLLLVYFYANLLFLLISKQGLATQGD